MISMRALRFSLLILPLFDGCVGVRHLEMGVSDKADSGLGVDRNHAETIPQHEYEPVRSAASAMLEGIRRYDNGDYQGAIEKLGESAIQSAPSAIQVEALKYTAFSYCVTGSYAKCRHAFDMALSIDASFELGPSEGGHPMWGPVFEQAKTAREKDRVRGSIGRESERWRSTDVWRAR